MKAICDASGKLMYPTQRDAMAIRARWRQTSRKRAIKSRQIPDRLYQCSYCGHWHLTKAEPRKR